MCFSLLGIVQLAVGAASSMMNYMGQQAAYKAQVAQYNANAKAARVATVNKYASQQDRLLQEKKAAATKKAEVGREALIARSKARVASGEAGVSGLSTDALLNDFYGQEGRYDASVDSNYAMTESYLRGEMVAAQDQGIARITSVPYPTKPSFLSVIPGFLNTGLKVYSSAQA